MFTAILQSLLFIFMVLLSLFLILIILLQRGKGGGLVGAFGGMGGSSAFGAKTSDVFLKITIWTAVIWFVACFGGRYILSMNSHNSMVDKATENALNMPMPVEMVDAPVADVPAADAEPTDVAPATDPAPVDVPTADSVPAADVPAAE